MWTRRRAVVETRFVLRACPPQAIAAVAGHFIPDGAAGPKRQIAPRPVERVPRPLDQSLQALQIVFAGKQAASSFTGQLQPPQADVVAAPLDQHGRELARNHRVEQWQILRDQLLLQTDRVGGDDDSKRWRVRVARCGGGQDRRDQIGKTLADPGTRFDHRVSAVGQRGGHSVGHLQLLVAKLVVLQPRRDATSRPENVAWSEHYGERAAITPSVGLLAVAYNRLGIRPAR